MGAPREELKPDFYQITHDVGPGQHGIRLDAFLKDYYRKRSREHVKRLIEGGWVTVRREQGRHVTLGRLKPSSQLLHGDEVIVLREKLPEPDVCFDYKVLYEDEAIFVIEKPANLPVHPAGRYFFNTLLVHLRTEGHKNPLKADREYFLVHRIDKETSGVLVLAKEREVCAHLVAQFAERKTEKRYYAVVHGNSPDEFTIDQAMRRALRSRIALKMEIAPEAEGALSAKTDFKTIRRAGDYSVVECFPKTGRQHQIRVHLDFAGYPIVGDKLYGRPESEAFQFFDRQHLTPETVAKLILPRHALHSAGIRFEHPVTGQRMEFRSELPADLESFIQSQNQNRQC